MAGDTAVGRDVRDALNRATGRVLDVKRRTNVDRCQNIERELVAARHQLDIVRIRSVDVRQRVSDAHEVIRDDREGLAVDALATVIVALKPVKLILRRIDRLDPIKPRDLVGLVPVVGGLYDAARRLGNISNARGVIRQLANDVERLGRDLEEARSRVHDILVEYHRLQCPLVLSNPDTVRLRLPN